MFRAELASSSSTRRFLRLIQLKDSYTSKHSQRVAQYAVAIGRMMNMSKKDLRVLWCGAILHDVGKLEIRYTLLNKRAPLTQEEWSILEKHPSRGEELAKSYGIVSEVLPIIRHHHERFDGTGYPDGLKGKEIPLTARIVTVADSFDAMTSERPYANFSDYERALNELEKHKGTQFCPEVVDSFFRVLEIDQR